MVGDHDTSARAAGAASYATDASTESLMRHLGSEGRASDEMQTLGELGSAVLTRIILARCLTATAGSGAFDDTYHCNVPAFSGRAARGDWGYGIDWGGYRCEVKEKPLRRADKAGTASRRRGGKRVFALGVLLELSG